MERDHLIDVLLLKHVGLCHLIHDGVFSRFGENDDLTPFDVGVSLAIIQYHYGFAHELPHDCEEESESPEENRSHHETTSNELNNHQCLLLPSVGSGLIVPDPEFS